MGIFDVFKSDKDKDNVIELKDKMKVKEAEEKSAISENDDYILSQERCNDLLQRIFNDKDHGESMMKEVSLAENIFILGYIENIVMPDLQKEKKEKEYKWFYTAMVLFRNIFCQRLMDKDKLWKVILKTTEMPFMDKGCEHILIDNKYQDVIIENLKNIHYDVEVVEISKEEFKHEFDEMDRNGYRGMCFSDGRQRPYYFSRESLKGLHEEKKEQYITNPRTQYSMIAFVQEARRNAEYEGAEEVKSKLETALVNSIIRTRFVIPIKKIDEKQAELPVYVAAKDEESNKVIPGIYVFTDKIEMQALEKMNLNFNDGWNTYSYDFPHLMNLLEQAHIGEIRMNVGSIDFKINKNSLVEIKKYGEEVTAQMSKKQEEWETVELPKMLKDKEVPMIRDSNGVPLFARNKDSVFMSKFVFDILSRREMKKEFMTMFMKDDDMDRISLYDADFRRISLKVKDEEKKNGLFIMPMRYEGENADNVVDDNTMHYTEDAAKVNSENGNEGEVRIEHKAMHFYTISNKENESIYMPIFSNEDEAARLYPRDHFRYCRVSYKDVVKNAKPYDGIVINPATMSFILEKDLLENIFDIENK